MTIDQLNYLIVPGYGNSDEKHWQSYFEKKLPNCGRLIQKSWESPFCVDWIVGIENALINLERKNTVLVSHSLGGIAIAHWAQKYDTNIMGAFIVAPPDIENPYLDLSLESFTPIPKHNLPFPSLIIASTDDPWASKKRSETFAANWGSKIKFIENAGHINTLSNYGEWHEGVLFLEEFANSLIKRNT